MKAKMFAFSKIERDPAKIEEKINTFMEDKTFKFSTISESSTRGQFYATVFYDEKKSNILVKAFRDNNKERLNKVIGEFLAGDVKMVFANQCSSSNNVTILIFYSLKKANDTAKEEENKNN